MMTQNFAAASNFTCRGQRAWARRKSRCCFIHLEVQFVFLNRPVWPTQNGHSIEQRGAVAFQIQGCVDRESIDVAEAQLSGRTTAFDRRSIGDPFVSNGVDLNSRYGNPAPEMVLAMRQLVANVLFLDRAAAPSVVLTRIGPTRIPRRRSTTAPHSERPCGAAIVILELRLNGEAGGLLEVSMLLA